MLYRKVQYIEAIINCLIIYHTYIHAQCLAYIYRYALILQEDMGGAVNDVVAVSCMYTMLYACVLISTYFYANTYLLL